MKPNPYMSHMYQFTTETPPSPLFLDPKVLLFKLRNSKCTIPFTITCIVYCLCRKLHLSGRDSAKCITQRFLCHLGPQLRHISLWLSTSQYDVHRTDEWHFQDWPMYDPPYSLYLPTCQLDTEDPLEIFTFQGDSISHNGGIGVSWLITWRRAIQEGTWWRTSMLDLAGW